MSNDSGKRKLVFVAFIQNSNRPTVDAFNVTKLILNLTQSDRKFKPYQVNKDPYPVGQKRYQVNLAPNSVRQERYQVNLEPNLVGQIH